MKSFGTKYGFPPSQAAHTCYCADPALCRRRERAGSFNPCAVAEALEGFEFDGLGNGPTCIAAKTTSASKTCWLCAARRTRPANSTCSKSSRSPRSIRFTYRRITDSLPAASWAPATRAPKRITTIAGFTSDPNSSIRPASL